MFCEESEKITSSGVELIKTSLFYDVRVKVSSFRFAYQGDYEHHDRYHFQPPDPHDPDKDPF